MEFRRKTGLAIVLCLCVMGTWIGCSEDVPDPGVMIDFNQIPYPQLSDYGFFQDPMRDLQEKEGILPYDLNTALFTDYAGKSRFVYMPENVSASYTAEGVLDFPDGAILIKNFFYDNDFTDPNAGRNIIETRLLVLYNGEWEAHSYIWNEAQTEAEFAIVGEQRSVSWIHYDGTEKTANYLIPNKNECKSCHSLDTEISPIGPKIANMNKNYSYQDGSMNQLEKWEAIGFLDGSPGSAAAPRMPEWDEPSSGTLEDRAKAYLDINCGHCHNPQGPANNSGLTLAFDETNPFALGICKPPVAAGAGSGGFDYDIIPGKPDSSILIFRMESNQVDIAMPEIGRSVIHEEAVVVIREWIANMEGDCP